MGSPNNSQTKSSYPDYTDSKLNPALSVALTTGPSQTIYIGLHKVSIFGGMVGLGGANSVGRNKGVRKIEAVHQGVYVTVKRRSLLIPVPKVPILALYRTCLLLLCFA